MADWDVIWTAPSSAAGPSGSVSGPIESAVDPTTGRPTIVVTPAGAPPRPKREDIVKFWIGKGTTPAAAEGIADRVNAESGFNPVEPGDGGTSIGLYQHHADRKAKLEALPNWQHPEVQNEFAFSEVTGGDPTASAHWDEIKSATSRTEAAKLWDKYFERSKGGPGAAGGGWQVTSAKGWNVSPNALAYEQARADTGVYWAPPVETKDNLPSIEDTPGQTAKAKALNKSLDRGDNIESIPSLEVSVKDGVATVLDYDGRHRLQAAEAAGVDLAPIALHGVPAGVEIKEIKWPNGKVTPFDFKPVAAARVNPQFSAGQAVNPAAEAATNRALFGAGVGTTIGGGAQLLSHVLPAPVVQGINDFNNYLVDKGLPLARVPQGGIDQMERQRAAQAEALQAMPHAYGMMGAGEAAPFLAAPAGAPAATLGRNMLRGAAAGAGIGAMQPVDTSGGGGYALPKAAQIGGGALLGGVLPAVGAAAFAAAGKVGASIVGAVSRWLGKSPAEMTPAQQAIVARMAQSAAAGGPTAQDILDLAAANPTKPLTLADLGGKRVQSLLGRVGRRPGPAQELVAEAREGRGGLVRHARVSQDIGQGLGDESDLAATRALAQVRSASAQPLFEQAFQPQSIAPIEQQFREAFGEAYDRLGDSQSRLAAALEKAGEAGESVVAAREDATAPARPQDIIQFLLARGGVKDEGGELRAMDLNLVSKGYFGRLSRSTGMPLDTAREIAAEAGFISPDANINELLDAFYNTTHGAPVFNPSDPETVNWLEFEGRRRAAERYGDPDRVAAATAEQGAARAAADQARQHVLEDTRQFHTTRGALAAAKEAERAGVPGGVWTPRLQRLMGNPEFRPGLATGMRIQRNEADARGERFNPLDYAITGTDAAGNPIAAKVPNMRLLHAAKRGLDNIVEGYRDPVTGRLVLDQLGRSQNELLRALKQELRRVNPTYGKALDAWSGPSQSMDAVEWGGKVLNARPELIAERMARMSVNDKEFARLGLANTLRKQIDRTDASPGSVRRMLSTYYRDRLAPMFPEPADFERFAKSLEAEGIMAKTDQVTAGNSLTAERLAEDQSALDPTAIRAAGYAGMHLAHGNIMGAALHGLTLGGRLMPKGNPELDLAIARILTEPLGANTAGMDLLNKFAGMAPKTRNYFAGRGAALGRLATPFAVNTLGQ